MNVRVRIGVCMLLLAVSVGFGVAMVPAEVVRAVDECGKVVPWAALDGNATVTDGASGAAVVGGTVTAVEAGGATTAAALSGGTVLAGAAAFYATFALTCDFLDWATGDGDGMFCDVTGIACSSPVDPGPTATEGDLYFSDTARCNTFPTLSAVSTTTWCHQVVFPSAVPADTVFRSTFDTPSVGTFTVGANNFTGPSWTRDGASGSSDMTLYPEPATANSIRGEWYRPTGGASSCRHDSLGSGCITWSGVTGVVFRNVCEWATPGSVYSGITGVSGSLVNVGGNCGRHPQQIMVGYNRLTDDVGSVFNVNPTARVKGWSRRIVSDVQCKLGVGGTTRWVRAESEVYFDRLVSSLIKVPDCDTGEIPVRVVSSRVPTGVTCSLGVACWGSSSLITEIALDSDLTATATAPDWVECLEQNNDCGAPELDGATCTWGGHGVGSDFCNPDEQSRDDPRTTGTRVPILPEPGDRVNTADLAVPDPDEGGDPPGGGVTVNVPIDDGGEDSRRGAALLTEEENAECWPGGWGWFNPAEWVLRPLKCAFVPDGAVISGEIDAFVASLEEQLPFSFAFKLIDFATALQESMAATEGGCFETGGTFSFGEFGSVPVNDVCIGAGPGTGGGWVMTTEVRQMIATLFVFGIWFHVARHAFKTIKGIVTGETGNDFFAEGSW